MSYQEGKLLAERTSRVPPVIFLQYHETCDLIWLHVSGSEVDNCRNRKKLLFVVLALYGVTLFSFGSEFVLPKTANQVLILICLVSVEKHYYQIWFTSET